MTVEIWRCLLVDRIGITVKIVSKELYSMTKQSLWKLAVGARIESQSTGYFVAERCTGG